ncbi:glycoside hydrolase [Obelidium mucronatum]|nr:glycoside hydrolase [Obelidium mucronatum]
MVFTVKKRTIVLFVTNLVLGALVFRTLSVYTKIETVEPPGKPTPLPVLVSAGSGGLNLPLFLASSRNHSDRVKMEKVKEMMQHAWGGYVKYAWGHDDLNPVSKTPHDWYRSQNLLNTPVDSLDTLYIMGMREEYKAAKKLVLDTLDFSTITEYVSLFETNIRVLGGLLSAYDLEGDEAFLRKAVELADRMLPAFDTPTGIPINDLKLATGEVKENTEAVLSELGSLQLEFQYLSDVTGNPIYAEKALYVFEQMQTIKVDIPGVFPDSFNPYEFGVMGNKVAIGGRCDSYYEYLLKLWLSTGDKKYFDMYYVAAKGIADNMVITAAAGHIYIPAGRVTQAGNKFSVISETMFEHLTCFAGGMFATGALASRTGDWVKHLSVGAGITEACWKMYNQSSTGIGSENCDGESLRLNNQQYILRPEAVESLFYMWRFTHDQVYRDRAWTILLAYEKYCRNDAGYHGLQNADSATPLPIDRQESFFLAETLKYLYLIFADDDTIPLEKYVFNTEAHPLSVRGHGKRADSSKFVPLPPKYKTPIGKLNPQAKITKRKAV